MLDVVGVDGVSGTTVIDCDAVAEAYVSFPGWLAVMRHVPVVVNVTTPDVMVHTALELLATATVAARNALLETRTVYVEPGVGLVGGVDWNDSDCGIFVTEMVWVSDAAK